MVSCMSNLLIQCSECRGKKICDSKVRPGDSNCTSFLPRMESIPVIRCKSFNISNKVLHLSLDLSKLRAKKCSSCGSKETLTALVSELADI